MSRAGDIGSEVTAVHRANYRELLRDGSFFRFFLGQVMSSFGDWVGLLAILALVKRIYDDEFAVAAVLIARLGPALFFGPVAGVVVDRWDRKKVMVAADVARAGLILTLPFVDSISSRVPLLSPVVLLFVISAGLEMLTLLWQPAKDASVPDMVRTPGQYAHAYSLLLMAAYATFPLSGATFGLFTGLSRRLGESFGFSRLELSPENLAFFFDSFTFLISAGLTLTLVIAPRKTSKKQLRFKAIWEDLLEGLKFITRHRMVRAWVLGIGGAFAGIGVFMSLALFFVSDVLNGGAAGFGLLVTAVGVGLGAGFVLAGPVSTAVPKDILFSSVVVAMGASLVGFGSVSTLTSALVMGSLCGLFGGFAYPTGYALIQEKLGPGLRGRASAAVNSVIRLAVVGAAALAPILVKLIDQVAPDLITVFPGQQTDVRGIRVVMWLGGLMIFAAGLVTTRAVRARWGMLSTTPGVFVVFEGGEGAGKSTQIERLRDYLVSQGRKVLVTREPGGTTIGDEIRRILLQPDGAKMSPKAEALLYAADRAQHVEETLRPNLEQGAIVISDRYIDSSVAYQGMARGLGAEEIRELNRWGTGGLFPDLVFLFDVDAQTGLNRSGMTDRIEREGIAFHEKVREAYRMLAERHPQRFVVIDGTRGADAITEEIKKRVAPYLDRSNPVLKEATA